MTGGVLAVAYPVDDLDVVIELYYDSAWNDISEWVLTRDGINIHYAYTDEGDRADPSTATLTLNNRDGRFSLRRVGSPLYGKIGRNTQIRITVDGSVRFVGEVANWPTRWGLSGQDVYVPIEAASISRRLNQGRPLRSPLYRTMIGVAPDDYVPAEYWSFEGGKAITEFGSELDGGKVATISGDFEPADAAHPIGSSSLPTFDLDTTVTLPIRAYTDTDNWVMQFVCMTPSKPAADPQVIMEWSTPGSSVDHWKLTLEDDNPNPDSIFLRGYDSSDTLIRSLGTAITDGDIGTAANFYGHTFMFTVAGWINSGTQYFGFWGTREDQLQMEPAAAASTVGNTHASVSGSVLLRSPGDGAILGHWALYTDPNFTITVSDTTPGQVNAQAMNGYSGETVDARWARVNTEEEISYVLTGTSGVIMGPQVSGTLADVYADIAATDHGLAFDTRSALSVTLRTTSDYYNQAAALALLYDDGYLDEMSPVDDDRYVANLIVARQPAGTSVTAELTSGTLSTADPPDGVGEYGREYQVNTALASDLTQHANWLLALGTLDEARYPRIGVIMVALAHTDPALYAAAKSVDIGDRITIDRLPDWLPPDVIDQQVIGYDEHIGDRNVWRIEFICRPHTVYSQVGVYATDPGGKTSRYQLTDCTLAADFDPTSDTTFTVTTATAPLLAVKTYSPALQLDVGGYLIQVGEVTGASNPQTCQTLTIPSSATVTRSSGSTVTLGPDQRARYGL